MAAGAAPITPGTGIAVAVDVIAENLTGTVAKNGTTTVTGTGSAFTTELVVGGVIRIPGTASEDRIISAIASDTSLTVSLAFTNTASGQTGQRVSEVQKVKQLDPTAGTATGIGIASNPQRVDPTGTTTQPVNVAQINGVTTTMGNGVSGTGVQRVTVASDSTGVVGLAAGTNGIGKLTANAGVNIGDVRNRPSAVHSRFAIAGLTTVTTTYTIGDQAGTMIAITGAASANGGTGILQSLAFLDEGDVGVDYRVHFFRSNVTIASDNSPFAVSDTDMRDWCGTVVPPSLLDLGANRASMIGTVGMGYDTGAGTTLYAAVETRTANAVYAAATNISLTPYLVLD
jgi:hypothetical protein